MTPQRKSPSEELLNPNLASLGLVREFTESSEESWDISPRGRKQKLKQKHSKSTSKRGKREILQDTNPNTSSATNSSTECPSPSPSSNPRNAFSIIELPSYTPSLTLNLTTQSIEGNLMAFQTKLFVCSIGNPAPYSNTLHSAGHILLNALATSLSFPAFKKSNIHAQGLLSTSSNPDHQAYTLWQSPSHMNNSGRSLSLAWARFNRDTPPEYHRKLVVIHDELELPPGLVRLKKGTLSAKGHNGLKSVKNQIQGPWWRIGVGIGRPVSREQDVVSNYVLKQLTAVERQRIEGAVVVVEAELRRLCEVN